MFDEETQKELLEAFFSENREALQRIEQGLLQLELNPLDPQLLNAVFRDMHTIKGNCRMMGFARLEELTHRAETLLDLWRDGKLVIDQTTDNVLLNVLDAVHQTLDTIEQSGSEGDPDFSVLLNALDEYQETAHFFSQTDHDDADLHPSKNTVNKDNGWEGVSLEQMASQVEVVDHLGISSPPTGASPTETTKDSVVKTEKEIIRLPIERLNDLMDRVGELGTAFNQLRYLLTRNPDHAAQTLERMGQQIYLLQDEVRQYRLQPIGRIWEGYRRMVRDLAAETGKKVRLEFYGEETQADHNILLSIKESLGHLLRNSVDHGIEPPKERSAKGKSEVGCIKLYAKQKHGRITMDVIDDGRGIDPNKVLAKAIERKLVSAQQAAAMKAAEVLSLIMLPGFSTAEQVSKISGRGTGMDVVQCAISKVGGTFSISSVLGEETRFSLQIPQAMAIVPILLLQSGGGTYAIPQISIRELISLYGVAINQNVANKMQSLMVRVRDNLLPMVILNQILARDGPGRSVQREFARIQAAAELHVVVLQFEDSVFALEVEQIGQPTHLVIKPLDRVFSHVTILSGTAVMPDGSIAFLLNVPKLIGIVDE